MVPVFWYRFSAQIFGMCVIGISLWLTASNGRGRALSTFSGSTSVACELVELVAINPLDSKRNYSATSNNTKLVHWPFMGGLLHLVQRGGSWAGCGPAQSSPRCTKYNSPSINGQCTNRCIAI